MDGKNHPPRTDQVGLLPVERVSGPVATPDDADAELAPASVRANVLRIRNGVLAREPEGDVLAEEMPIALEYNGISHATMLATPADLEDFAVGFSLTEGIVDHAHDIRDIELRTTRDGIIVALTIAGASQARFKERRRALSGRTGCGLCGVETLPEVLRDIAPVPSGARVSARAVLDAMRALRERQSLHTLTGATHAAGWADADGVLRLVREDVGRHNALDKLIGALARRAGGGADTNAAAAADADVDPDANANANADTDAAAHASVANNHNGKTLALDNGLIVVSSRASFEMVQKTAAAGVGILAAISAPTALAQRLAERLNIALLGFMRENDTTLYAHAERLGA